MFYTQTQPGQLFDVGAIKDHLRIDGVVEDTYLLSLIVAATAHAEKSMACSLLNRTVTATFYAGEVLSLPRGPVQSLLSVAVGATPAATGAYTMERYGTIDVLRYNGGTIQPYAAPTTLTVTYTAGYGDDPAAVPADILHVIKCHVGLLYENREVATDRTITPVPFISEFYKLHSREPGVG